MTRMFILAVGLVIGMVFNAAPLMAQCPTDDSGCEWKAAAEPLHLLGFQRDTTFKSDGTVKSILVCSTYVNYYVCYRCCNGNFELRLSYAILVDEYGRPIKDVLCPLIWRMDNAFWKRADEGIITYGFLQGRYVDCKGGPTVVGSLPDCDPAGNKTIVTYYKANCFKYDNSGVRDDWRLLPCDGSGLCKQEWALCKKARIGADGKIDGYDMIKKRVSVTSTGGCYTVPLGDKLVPDCYPSCWP